MNEARILPRRVDPARGGAGAHRHTPPACALALEGRDLAAEFRTQRQHQDRLAVCDPRCSTGWLGPTILECAAVTPALRASMLGAARLSRHDSDAQSEQSGVG